MLRLFVGKGNVPISITKFPAGETHISIQDSANDKCAEGLRAIIDMKFESNEDLINLALLKDCVDRYYANGVQTALVMDYVPYGRQDRVCNLGESLSVKVIADLINSLGFSKVYTKNNHSDVSTGLIDRCVNTELEVLTRELPSILRKGLDTILVSPDAGANKKVFKMASTLGFKHVIRADKTRDVSTGKITGTKVYWEQCPELYGLDAQKDVLIVDDIADGGYTFIKLAEELRKHTEGKIYLYVTHGIFSKGFRVFDGVLDGIYVSNPLCDVFNESMVRVV